MNVMKQMVWAGLLAGLGICASCGGPQDVKGVQVNGAQPVQPATDFAEARSTAGQVANPKGEDNLLAADGQEDSREYEGGAVCRSTDGRITIRAGMHPDSGTSPDYWTVWTLVTDAGKKRVITFDFDVYISRIHTIVRCDGSTYYLMDCSSKASSSDGYNYLQAYRIAGDSIRQVNVVDGGPFTDGDDSWFSVNYSIPHWYFATDGYGYDWLFAYDAATRKLYVPLAEQRQLTDRYEVWQFDGNRFVALGPQPHMHLHPRAGNYRELVRYMETDGYLMRVDRMPHGSLRYASWARPKTMADAPDLLIDGGKKRTYTAAGPDEVQLCDDYYFRQGSYEYIVDSCATVNHPDGSGTHTHYLVVKHHGKVVFKQASRISN